MADQTTNPSPPPEEPGYAGQSEVLDAIRKKRGWFIFLGIVMIIAGMVAIIYPFMATIAAKILFGWIMMVSGALTLWHAFQTRTWGSTIWNLLIGILTLGVGVYLAFFPLTGILVITLVLGVTFLIEGIMEVIMGFQNRDNKGWGWVVASGVATLILGGLLLYGFPGTAVWALGILVGIHFITSGSSMLALAMAAKRL
ncbi:HdeD family acid-resistance protein [Pseudoruegeria sp. HB172150]|uniref:HdeD family acid-resistance protein n=1 Tax=Pseudoruegeria sp. HB172150 TaxID=2721164 RepID=UPI001553665F|nr:HdeD family acid-resistance protein [Pseudoruegeria sp. HB172150]